jgi:hypothetical protein
MKNFILGTLIFESIPAFTKNYTCTMNTNNGFEYDLSTNQAVFLENIVVENISVNVGDNFKIFPMKNSTSEVVVSFQDGASIVDSEPRWEWSKCKYTT